MNHTCLLPASVNEWRSNHFTLLLTWSYTSTDSVLHRLPWTFPQTSKQIEILYLCTSMGDAPMGGGAVGKGIQQWVCGADGGSQDAARGLRVRHLLRLSPAHHRPASVKKGDSRGAQQIRTNYYCFSSGAVL
jgi:hypothetical protein